MELVPPLLHVLEVDKHANNNGSSSSCGSGGLDSAYAQGGIDFGNIAVYTCSNPNCRSTEEYCVVQDSIDERPTGPKRQMPRGDALIEEVAKFDDENDEDDDDDEDDMSEDDEDEESW